MFIPLLALRFPSLPLPPCFRLAIRSLSLEGSNETREDARQVMHKHYILKGKEKEREYSESRERMKRREDEEEGLRREQRQQQ